jgi:hypothetical protein
MNDGDHKPQLPAQLQQQPQQRNGINPPGNGYPNAFPGPQQFLLPNLSKQALRQ